MATGNPYRRPAQLQDFTAQLPPGSPSADPGMVVQPYANPGYGMPNAFVGNLNQAPGQTVGGYLPANALQVATPSASGSGNPLLQGDASQPSDPLSQWLAQQRAKNGTSQWAGMYPTDMGYMPPGSARVVPDKMYDVPPVLDMGNINIADPQARQLSVQERQWWDMLDSLKRAGASQDVIDYHMSQNPQVMVSDRWSQEGQRAPQDANAIMRAMMLRQQQLRR